METPVAVGNGAANFFHGTNGAASAAKSERRLSLNWVIPRFVSVLIVPSDGLTVLRPQLKNPSHWVFFGALARSGVRFDEFN